MILSVKEVAKKLNKSEATIRRWAISGKLSARKCNQRWEILSTEINDCKRTTKKINNETKLESVVDKIVQGVTQKIVDSNNANRETELEKEIKYLSLENEAFKNALKKVHCLVKQLEKDQKKISAKLETQEQIIYKQALQISTSIEWPKKQEEQVQIQETEQISQVKSKTAQIGNEDKAEFWARNNTEKWLDKNCRAGRSWRELATNIGEQVCIRGKMQKPRSHLHIIMKTDKSAWNRMKAKVALDMFPSENQYANHYGHPLEVGG